MMLLSKTISLAAVLAVLSVGGVAAQSLRGAEEPAEFPPASFKGSQYVDSKGCVYVRAGYGDTVNWVPRVTRSRKVLCGFKPTQVAGATAPVIADPKPTSTPAPVAKTVAAAATKPAAPVATQPSATPVQVAATTKSAAPKPAAIPAAEALAGKTVGAPGCTATHDGLAVRCGPQSEHPADYILKRLPAGVTVRTAEGERITTQEPTLVRIPVAAPAPKPVPAPVVKPTIAAASMMAAATPQPATTCANLSGNAAQYMQTDSRLAVRCGPQAVHPSEYVIKKQARAVAAQENRSQVARVAAAQGYTLPKPVEVKIPEGYKAAWDDGRLNPNRGPQTARGDLQQAQVWTQETPARDVAASATSNLNLSTRGNAVATTPVPAQAGLRYVQVGAFGDPANANGVVARLSGLGLPVSSQVTSRGGKTIKIVLAGPFASPQQTLSALGSVKAAGYADAFARK
ncbi:SPOR domain-containing protein [Celeribacter sp.]|uniref:SPOR domain-containing protein n=1 Tax=Celeribacter sp. TaxID=1890673 RepID=UPI003A95CA47